MLNIQSVTTDSKCHRALLHTKKATAVKPNRLVLTLNCSLHYVLHLHQSSPTYIRCTTQSLDAAYLDWPSSRCPMPACAENHIHVTVHKVAIAGSITAHSDKDCFLLPITPYFLPWRTSTSIHFSHRLEHIHLQLSVTSYNPSKPLMQHKLAS